MINNLEIGCLYALKSPVQAQAYVDLFYVQTQLTQYVYLMRMSESLPIFPTILSFACQ